MTADPREPSFGAAEELVVVGTEETVPSADETVAPGGAPIEIAFRLDA